MVKSDFVDVLRTHFPDSFVVKPTTENYDGCFACVDGPKSFYSFQQKGADGKQKTARDLAMHMVTSSLEYLGFFKHSPFCCDMCFIVYDNGAPLAKGPEQNKRNVARAKSSSDAIGEAHETGDGDHTLRNFDPKTEKLEDYFSIEGLDKPLPNMKDMMANRELRGKLMGLIGGLIQATVRLALGKVLVLDGAMSNHPKRSPIAIVGMGINEDPEVYAIDSWRSNSPEADLRIFQICDTIIPAVNLSAIFSDYVRKIGTKVEVFFAGSRDAPRRNVGFQVDFEEKKAKVIEQKKKERAEVPTVYVDMSDTDALIINLLTARKRISAYRVEQDAEIVFKAREAAVFKNHIFVDRHVIVADSKSGKYIRTTRGFRKLDLTCEFLAREMIDLQEMFLSCFCLMLGDEGEGAPIEYSKLTATITNTLQFVYSFAMVGVMKGNDFNTPLPTVNLTHVIDAFFKTRENIGPLFCSTASKEFCNFVKGSGEDCDRDSIERHAKAFKKASGLSITEILDRSNRPDIGGDPQECKKLSTYLQMARLTPHYERYINLVKCAYIEKYAAEFYSKPENYVKTPLEEVRRVVATHYKKAESQVPSDRHLFLMFKRFAWNFHYWSEYDDSYIVPNELALGFILIDEKMGPCKENCNYEE